MRLKLHLHKRKNLNFIRLAELRPASSLNSNVFVSRTVGLRLKSWPGQIGHRVADGSKLLRHFFERSYVARA